MAKRRDVHTRRWKRWNKQDSEKTGRRVQVQISDLKGGQRPRGRRGVRDRARKARIQARIANGTYRQPSGGGGSNS